KAAAEEGIVPGGGVAYLRASQSLAKLALDDTDEQVGVNIVKRALEEPVRQIAQNAGWEGAVVVGKILDSKEVTFGFNAETEKYEDLVGSGVIDPTMVTRTALQNASSIASLLLTTEALVTEVPEEEKAPAPGAGGPPMGGMDY
ncbi:MAG: TCP-1/cpn60 chaperonin family protein, partial [Acidobacteriota bacterium]